MTYRALYILARQRLAAAGVDSPGYDAALLAERFLGLDRPALAVHGEKDAPPQEEGAFLRALAEREARRPLQYILGEWPFLGLTLKVGEGVLVPREDTVVLVEAVARRLQGLPAPRGLDLCAGTGAVGLGLCSLLPGGQAACVEADQRAMAYLRANVERYPQYQAAAVAGDVLAGPVDLAGELDFIVSNPPYIAEDELSGLQPEVRREPELALNGGRDGLVFYRAILEKWLPLLKPGGILGVEIGDSQGNAVRELFQAAGLREIELCQDLAGLDRAVTGIKEKAHGS